MNKRYIDYDVDEFIFGEPVFVKEVGKVRFLSYREYLRLSADLSVIKMNVLHIFHHFRKVYGEEDAKVLEALDNIKKDTLFNLVRRHDSLSYSYIRVLATLLDCNNYTEEETMNNIEKIFEREDLFLEVRQLLLDMQALSEDEVSSHPRIQKGIEMSRKMKAVKSTSTLNTMASTIAMFGNKSYKEVGDMTVIQFFSSYLRVGAFKDYESSVLFRSVGAEVDIEGWNRNIDLFEKEKSSMKRSDYEKGIGDILN